MFDICLLLYVQSWTPGDGRKDRPKHVECYSKIKKFETLVHLVGFTIEVMCFILDNLTLYHGFMFVFLVVHWRTLSSNVPRQFVEGFVRHRPVLHYVFSVNIWRHIRCLVYSYIKVIKPSTAYNTTWSGNVITTSLILYIASDKGTVFEAQRLRPKMGP